MVCCSLRRWGHPRCSTGSTRRTARRNGSSRCRPASEAVSMWDALIINPFTNLLLLIYYLLGRNFAIAIIVFTVVIRLITYPLTIQQQKSAKAMQVLQPQIQALQKKYAKDKEKLNQETMKLYQEAGINPLGGCLPLLLQFPIFIGLYQVILLVMAVNPLQMLNLSKQIYSSLPGLV